MDQTDVSSSQISSFIGIKRSLEGINHSGEQIPEIQYTICTPIGVKVWYTIMKVTLRMWKMYPRNFMRHARLLEIIPVRENGLYQDLIIVIYSIFLQVSFSQ